MSLWKLSLRNHHLPHLQINSLHSSALLFLHGKVDNASVAEFLKVWMDFHFDSYLCGEEKNMEPLFTLMFICTYMALVSLWLKSNKRNCILPDIFFHSLPFLPFPKWLEWSTEKLSLSCLCSKWLLYGVFANLAYIWHSVFILSLMFATSDLMRLYPYFGDLLFISVFRKNQKLDHQHINLWYP